MPTPFLTVLVALVLQNLPGAQGSRDSGAHREQPRTPPIGAVLTDAPRTAGRELTGAALARYDVSQGGPLNAGGVFVSATSLAAPPAARKAYAKADREMGKKKPDPARAAAALETAVTLYPSFAAAWYFLGGIRLVLNDIENARGAFESSLSADPRFPYPYLPLIALQLSTRRYAEAARLADSVLKLNYGLMEAHYYRALANGMLRRYDNARQSIEKIVDTGSDRQYPGVHAMLAVIFLEQGDQQSAANEYRHLLNLDPDSPVAAEAGAYLAKWRAVERSRGESQPARSYR
jgi:Tfp pilus assembly protein PilF